MWCCIVPLQYVLSISAYALPRLVSKVFFPVHIVSGPLRCRVRRTLLVLSSSIFLHPLSHMFDICLTGIAPDRSFFFSSLRDSAISCPCLYVFCTYCSICVLTVLYVAVNLFVPVVCGRNFISAGFVLVSLLPLDIPLPLPRPPWPRPLLSLPTIQGVR